MNNKYQPTKEIREFPSRVSVTLENNVNIPTDSYNEYIEEYDDNPILVIETNQIDWEHEYLINCIPITEMLRELRQYINNELRNSQITFERERYLNKLLEESYGWIEREINVSEL